MKQKIILFLTLASILISGCNIIRALKTLKHIGKADFTGNNYLTEIPFEFITGHLLIKVKVNNELKNFFLDTGAPTVISPNLTKELNLKTFALKHKDDTISTSFPLIDKININDLLYSNIGAVEGNTNEMFKRGCEDIDGLIGANIMCKNIWQIDFQQNKIRLTDDLSKLNYIDKSIKISFETIFPSKSPIITVKLSNGKNIKLVFDTGSNSDITFNTDSNKQFVNLFDQKNISEIYSKGYNSILGKEVMEQIDTAYFINTNLYLGNDSIISQSLTYGRYKNYSESKNGVIGNEFLKYFIITINWSTKTIFLYKYKEQKEKIRNFGFSYGFVDNKLFVGAIYKKTETEKIGINIGDEIIEINGYKVSDLTTSQLCDYANDKFVLIPYEQEKATFVFKTKKGEIKTEMIRQ